ncbi:MAG: hypothetical protein AAFQ98_17480 [Bacteroidota bacterium]
MRNVYLLLLVLGCTQCHSSYFGIPPVTRTALFTGWTYEDWELPATDASLKGAYPIGEFVLLEYFDQVMVARKNSSEVIWQAEIQTHDVAVEADQLLLCAWQGLYRITPDGSVEQLSTQGCDVVQRSSNNTWLVAPGSQSEIRPGVLQEYSADFSEVLRTSPRHPLMGSNLHAILPLVNGGVLASNCDANELLLLQEDTWQTPWSSDSSGWPLSDGGFTDVWLLPYREGVMAVVYGGLNATWIAKYDGETWYELWKPVWEG